MRNLLRKLESHFGNEKIETAVVGKSILVRVDNNPKNREMVKSFLSKEAVHYTSPSHVDNKLVFYIYE